MLPVTVTKTVTSSTNDRTCFAFHRSALGVGVGIAPKTEINYIRKRLSWLQLCLNGVGAIDTDGIVMLFVTSHKELLKWHL